MKNLIRFTLALALLSLPMCAQLTTTSTTLNGAVTASVTRWCLGSATGVVTPSVTAGGTYLAVDTEAALVLSAASGTACYNVRRGALGTVQTSHLTSAVVWVGNAATSTGDSSRPFSGGAFVKQVPTGPCTASAQYTLPVIVVGNLNGVGNGQAITCTSGGYWGRISSYYVPPTQCTFAPTTLTTTNTYPQIGASTLFVLNGTSNAAAGTNTLVCNILPPTSVTLSQGAALLDITLFIGSQTTAPTSLGTSTLGSITFPAAATTEVASTVTPVAAGGTVTTTSPTLITTVTTAGSFLTIKHTYASLVRFSTDLQVFQYTMPFLQSAAAAMALNTPGLIVHYTNPTTQ